MGPLLTIVPRIDPLFVGAPGQISFSASGAEGILRWRLIASTLPAEWAETLTVTDGVASIAAEELQTPGTYAVTLEVSDATRVPVRTTFDIRVVALPLQVSGELSDWIVTVAVDDVLTLSGGSGHYDDMDVTSGALPAGVTLTLAGDELQFTGSPIATGTWAVVLRVTDSNGAYIDIALLGAVTAPEIVISGVLPPAVQGAAYSATLAIGGGVPGYSLVSVTGAPAGLTVGIAGASINVTGPVAAGTASGSPYALSIEIADSLGTQKTYSQSFVVDEPASLDAETVTWESRITTLGGSVTSGEITTADALIKAIKAESFNSKIIYLLPFIGASIAAHRVPLRDTRNVGAASLIGGAPFTDANCDTATGLVNSTEQAAALNTGLNFASCNLSDANKGGLGFWERALGSGAGTECMGAYGSILFASKRFAIDLRADRTFFSWGDPNNRAQETTAATSAHYYGQSNGAASRKFYKNGSQVGAENTVNDSASGASGESLYVMGVNYENFLAGGGFGAWKGRCAVAYMTDGTLSDTEIADLHSLLNTYLITPTGR